MFWIIQENVAGGEESHEHFLEAVECLGDDYALVKNIPFILDIIPDINPPASVMVMGSVRLCQKLAPMKGWIDNFDFSIWRKKWKGNILNDDAVVVGLSQKGL